MDIKRAKQEIEHAVKAYLAVDDTGTPLIPPIRQRPILLMGPPGVGKTQIMEQIAQECGIALVAYTITHHTRQSAVGLPFIRHRNFGGADRSVTEYTMSEIIASVYDKMEQTGLEHGILFIDEINCVSETLAPTMLQFLQCKTFGNQAVPAGWVIVAAGNPPEYNKSVRDFDLVTLDRVRRIDIEPNLAVWQEYARAHRLHPAVQAYLELRPQHFYRIQNDVDGPQFVTARGWEDLSAMLTACTKLDLPVDEALIGQYLRHPEVARDFAAYWELYKKYRQDYGVEDILQGRPFAAVLERAQKAAFDERISLVSLLLEAVFLQMERCTLRHDALRLIVAALKAQRGTLDVPGDALTALAGLEDSWRAEANKAPSARQKVYLDLLSLTAQWHGELSGSTPFSALKACYQRSVADLQAEVAETQKKLGDLLRFLQEAFGKGTELSMAVNDLTVAPVATAFLGQFLSTDYFAASRDLLLHRQSEQLLHQIDLTGLV